MKYVIRPLFDKFQEELVSFVNTQRGKEFITTFGGKELKENYPIVKVTPDGIHQKIGKNLYRAVFYPRSPYVKHFAEVLTMVDIANDNYKVSKKELPLVIPHFMGETKLLRNKLPLIYLASPETFNPDAHPESTSVDGTAYRGGVDESWSTIHNGAGNGASDTNTDDGSPIILSSTTANQYQVLRRSFLLFDTSALPDTATITSVVLSIVSSGKYNAMGADTAEIVSSNPASNTSLVSADYSTLGSTSFGSITYANWVGDSSAYNDFTLNASGRSAVSLTGVSKYGFTFGWDLSGTFGGTWASGVVTGYRSTFADNGTNKPKLVVTYTVPEATSGTNSRITLLGVGI